MSLERPCPTCGETLPPYAKECRACGWDAAVAPRTNAGPPVMPSGPSKTRLSWREQWYADRGLPHEPPRVGNLGGIRVPVMGREPGCDEDELTGAK